MARFLAGFLILSRKILLLELKDSRPKTKLGELELARGEIFCYSPASQQTIYCYIAALGESGFYSPKIAWII